MKEEYTLERSLAALAATTKPSLAALQGLSDLPRSGRAAFLASWRRLPVETRRWAAEEMEELAEDDIELDFNCTYAALLEDEDEQVRATAAEALWESNEPEVADRLLSLLAQDPSLEVRAASAGALGAFTYLLEMGELDAGLAQRLREGLFAAAAPSQPVSLRRRAIESLGFIAEDDRVHAVIEAAFNAGDEDLRSSALFSMGRNCDTRWLERLLDEFQAESPRLRFEAARACGALEDQRAVPGLARLLVDSDQEVKLAAIQALGSIGGEQALKALRIMADSDDETVSEAAQEALAEAEGDAMPLEFGLDKLIGHDSHQHHSH